MGRPVAASPKNVENSTACMYLCSRVKRTMNRLGVAESVVAACISNSGIVPSISRFIPDLVVACADQPQDGMNHEEREHARQQQVHEQPNEIEPRTQLAVVRVSVGLVLHKAEVGA